MQMHKESHFAQSVATIRTNRPEREKMGCVLDRSQRAARFETTGCKTCLTVGILLDCSLLGAQTWRGIRGCVKDGHMLPPSPHIVMGQGREFRDSRGVCVMLIYDDL